MADGHKELGTQTYEQHLDELIEADQITEETKRAALATGRPRRRRPRPSEAPKQAWSPPERRHRCHAERQPSRILALPREAGTPEAAKARELVAAYLTGLGYTVVSQGFTFAPSSLRAFPIFGAGLGGLALVLFPLLVIPTQVPPWAALAVWSGGLLALAIVATGVGLGWVHLGEGLSVRTPT